MRDYLVKATAFKDMVRVYSANTTATVEEARNIHGTWPAATAALGRALTATVIMGSMEKGEKTITVQIEGGGPIGKIVCTANAHGEVRGFVTNPEVHISTNDGKLAVGSVVGNNGFIHVTKDLKVRDIFTSSSELQTGEIADDFTYYFVKSEQVPSSVGLGVLVKEDNSVISSGGFILQIMPGCSLDVLDQIEDNIRNMPPVSEMIESGSTPENLIDVLTKGDYQISERLDIKYSCDCNKDRFARGIISLGEVEIREMILDQKEIETVCHFCGRKYHFSSDELSELAEIASTTKKQKSLS